MIELNKLYNEDCRETMKRMENNSIDSIVTDPPYELGFMGKKWDSSGIAYNVNLWRECLRVLKPGGYLLAFGGTRTSHRMVCAIEDAGFEIRDSILWLYGSGFPKSMNIGKEIDKLQGNEREVISKQQRKGRSAGILGVKTDIIHINDKGNSKYEGWGTALKPAHEPICVARKPLSEKTVAQNVLKHGTGGINIDGCRIGNEEIKTCAKIKGSSFTSVGTSQGFNGCDESLHEGRFPANVILDDSDVILAQFPNTESGSLLKHHKRTGGMPPIGTFKIRDRTGEGEFLGDSGSASRFFYIAKADSNERNEGLYQFEKVRESDRQMTDGPGGANPRNRSNTNKNNFHPTVKPIKLIQYLQRLVTPKGGTTYDPFGGSGTSACSAINEGFNWILSEMILGHCDIANKRIYNQKGLF